MASPFELTRQMRAYETQTTSYQNFLAFSSQPSTSTFQYYSVNLAMPDWID
jgi:hypothetical protein